MPLNGTRCGPFIRTGTRGSPSWPGSNPETGYVDADCSDQSAEAACRRGGPYVGGRFNTCAAAAFACGLASYGLGKKPPSRERALAHHAGALELGLDLAATIQAENSLEKLLAHQLAANHRSIMKLTAQLNRCVENMDQGYRPEAQESANVQGTRLAGAIARMQGTFQSGMLALHKMRSGGQQTVRVVHQHVNVSDGAQAVVAGEMNTGQPTGGRARGRRGGSRK